MKDHIALPSVYAELERIALERPDHLEIAALGAIRGIVWYGGYGQDLTVAYVSLILSYVDELRPELADTPEA